jgi:hypothetical protein
VAMLRAVEKWAQIPLAYSLSFDSSCCQKKSLTPGSRNTSKNLDVP